MKEYDDTGLFVFLVLGFLCVYLMLIVGFTQLENQLKHHDYKQSTPTEQVILLENDKYLQRYIEKQERKIEKNK